MLQHKAFKYLYLFGGYEKLMSNLLQGNKGYPPVDGFGFSLGFTGEISWMVRAERLPCGLPCSLMPCSRY